MAEFIHRDTTHKGFSNIVLCDTFEKIASKDWRGPIDRIVDEAELAETMAAIEFYTATQANIELLPGSTRPQFRVTAIGYRAGPAGP